MNGHTDIQRGPIVQRQYHVAGYKNSVDPDQTAPYQFDLGLNCLLRPDSVYLG